MSSASSSTSGIPPVVPSEQPAVSKFDADPLPHLIYLVLASVVVSLSFLLNAPGGAEVTLPGTDRALPTLCVMRGLFQQDCPGCGLTRSFISFAHGNPAAAWKYNPAGMFLFLFVAAQIPYRGYQLWRIRNGRGMWRHRSLDWLVWIVVALLLAQWIAKALVARLGG